MKIEYTLVTPRGGGPAALFYARLTRRVGPRFDNIHKQVTIQLTTAAKAILEGGRVRPWESGARPHARLTGTLTGHTGHGAAIKATVLTPARGEQGRGVSFPDVNQLNRRARHWRVLEYGTPYVTMPHGVFTAGLGGAAQPLRERTKGDIFQTYQDFIRRQGLRGGSVRFSASRKRSSRARQKRVAPVKDVPRLKKKGFGRGWEGKFFLRQAWDQVVGPGGQNIFDRYRKAITEELGQFRS